MGLGQNSRNYEDLGGSAAGKGSEHRRASPAGADLILYGSDHHVWAFKSTGMVHVGCQKATIEYWLLHYKAIGKKFHYSPASIEEYGHLLRTVAYWMKACPTLDERKVMSTDVLIAPDTTDPVPTITASMEGIRVLVYPTYAQREEFNFATNVWHAAGTLQFVPDPGDGPHHICRLMNACDKYRAIYAIRMAQQACTPRGTQ